MLFFADFMRHSRSPPLRASTINQYVTHVADFYVTRSIVEDPLAFRSKRLTMLINGATCSAGHSA